MSVTSLPRTRGASAGSRPFRFLPRSSRFDYDGSPMRPAHLSSTPKRIASAFLGIAVLAGSLLHCNGILGDFSVGNGGDGGGNASGSDSATGGSADAASDSSTDATVQTNQDAGSDA